MTSSELVTQGKPGASVYQIKGWHLLLVTATILVSIGVSWGTLKSQVDSNSRDIEFIKSERYVPKEDYWRQMSELQSQVERLETKIDALTRLVK
jgi:hypothetical protein